MPCESSRSELDAYLDGELRGEKAAELQAHLRNCAACSAEALRRSQLKRIVAAAGRRYTPSAELRAKIIKVATKPEPPFRWFWNVVAVPAALVLILSVGVRLYLNHQSGLRQRVDSELVDRHIVALASSTPVDVASSDRHTVKPWFQGKLPFSFNLPELQGSDFTLVGGRVTYLEQAPGAQLVYQLRRHEMSVFIFQDRGSEIKNVPPGTEHKLSFNIDNWTEGGLHYFVVGDVSAAEMERLSQLLRDAG
jgi:anti-sigma factor RsiW